MSEKLVKGPCFEIHDVDYLEVELLPLPVTNLSVEYLIRFCKPVPLCLSKEPIVVPLGIDIDCLGLEKKGHEEVLKEEILKRWREGFAIDKHELDEVGEEVKKWYNLTDVRIHYLKLVRDE